MTNVLRFILLALLLVAAPVLAQTDTATQTSTETLLEVLKDDTARQQLIDSLEKSLQETTPSTNEIAAVRSIGQSIAEATQATAQRTAAAAAQLWQQLAQAPQVFRDARDAANGAFFLGAVQNLVAVILVTYVIFRTLLALSRRFYGRFQVAAESASIVKRGFLILLTVIMETTAVLVAWAAAYFIATAVIGDYGVIGIRQTLYLNAFVIVELFKVLVRAVFSPNLAALRPVPLADTAARFVSSRLGLVATILGYGQLLISPIVTDSVSASAGRSVSTILSLVAILILMQSVLSQRRPVARWITGDVEASPSGARHFLSETWHIPVLLYLAALFVIVLARPGGILLPLLNTSAQIVGIVLLGAIVVSHLRRYRKRGVQVPSGVASRLPLLERRLNMFVPNALAATGAFIAVIVSAVVLSRMGLFDLGGWFGSDIGLQITGNLVGLVLILSVGFGIWIALTSWIDYRLNPDYGSVPTSREHTLLSLLRNAATIAIIIITLMFALSKIGLNIAPLLASAGVLGLAIGFGAQKMVQDIISGIFIQFENAINVDDVITVGGTTGVVERLSIRSVSLRDVHGVYHIIPFSSVDMVSNYMREFAYSVCDMGVGYNEDTEEVRQAMLDAFDELKKDPEFSSKILEDMEWVGVNAFGDSAVVHRTRIKTLPGEQWGIGRAYNRILKRVFDARGIEIPYPHQTVFFGQAKDGSAPPVRIETALKGDTGAD